MKIIPKPKKVVLNEGIFDIKDLKYFNAEKEFANIIQSYIKNYNNLDLEFSDESIQSGNLLFIKKDKFKEEDYHIHIEEDKIRIEYNTQKGVFYALVTLSQIQMEYGEKLPICVIEDSPSFEVRGIMIDISRSKVPTLKTLLEYVDILSRLKINRLELYIEGLSFEYPSFKEFFESNKVLTGNEIKELDIYCKYRCIDLVPNQNTLGHMSSWLELDKFKELRDTEEGINILGRTMPPSTLNVADEKSVEFVKQLSDDLLQFFTSENYNMGLDEPFELGKGKSKELVDEIGHAKAYSNYVNKLYDYSKTKGKNVFMWGDYVSKYKEILEYIPKNITIMEWGYDGNHPFDRRAKEISEAGFPFILCAGTSSWTTFTGKTENMIENIKNAITAASKYNAKGLIVTDWGDNGHQQYPFVSYPGFIYGASTSWNALELNVDIASYINDYIYKDSTSSIGDIILDAGRYYKKEDFEMFNMTLSNLVLSMGLIPKEFLKQVIDNIALAMSEYLEPEVLDKFSKNVQNKKTFDKEVIIKYLDDVQNRLDKVKENIDLILYKEINNGLNMAKVGTLLRDYIENASIDSLNALKDLVPIVIKMHKELWSLRNKSDVDKSIEIFENVLKGIKNI